VRIYFPSRFISTSEPSDPAHNFLPSCEIPINWSPPATINDPSADIATLVISRPGDVFTIQSGSTACTTAMVMQDRSIIPRIQENAKNLTVVQRYIVTGTLK
jgi:hypothetical protein